MKFGLGILVLYLTVYTAKSLYVDENNNNNNTIKNNSYNESSKVMEQQQKSELIPKLIEVPEIKINLLPTTSKSTSSILNKLLPHDSPQKDEVSSAFKRVTLLPSLPSIDNFFFMQQDGSDDTSTDMQQAEMIEIEVPMIGKEYTRKTRDKVDVQDEYDNIAVETEDFDEYIEIEDLPTTRIAEVPQSTEPSTFFPDFQNSRSTETITKSFYQTPSSSHSTINEVSSYSTLATTTENIQDMHAIESKLMDQYHSSHNSVENVDESLIDELKFKKEEIVVGQPEKQYRHTFPFNVKVIVNNEDEKMSCKNKQSCSQVNFSTNRDIDQEYYKDDSDEDLFFKSDTDHYNEKPNQMKSRRAADDGFFNPFNGFSLTPAPRFGGVNNNFRVPQPIRKPTIIERLENESSLERSERVNKDLNNLMKFISVWAHVDKFVSDRARSTIKRLAFMTDDDYVDNFVLGSRKKIDNNLNSIAKNADEPFT